MFYHSRDRKGEHPQGHLARYVGILQADAYGGVQPALSGPAQARRAPPECMDGAPFFAMANVEENARRKAAGRKSALADRD
jgi:hypothetical protein